MNKAVFVPMGNSIFVTWPQIDNCFDTWAKAYFGDHVTGAGEREDSECYISLKGLKGTDEDKTLQLFTQYDKEHYEDPYDYFSLEEDKVLLPDCIARGVLSETFKEFNMNGIGNSLATQKGVFFMENELNYFNLFISQSTSQHNKSTLDAQIQEASGKRELQSTAHTQTKNFELGL